MNENMKKRNEVLAQTVIKGLESRNMTGYYAADKGEAGTGDNRRGQLRCDGWLSERTRDWSGGCLAGRKL